MYEYLWEKMGKEVCSTLSTPMVSIGAGVDTNICTQYNNIS